MSHITKIRKKLIDLGIRNYCTNALIELTGRCNARCDYCYIGDNKTHDLPIDKIFHIINKLDEAGVINLTLTGGEIFIRRDILDILFYISKKGFWFVNLLTNGTLIEDYHIDFLRTHYREKGFFRISVFSHIPEIHDEYVGIPGAFKKIKYVCKQLHDADINFRLSFNVLDFNYKSMNNTIEHFNNLGYKMGISTTKIIVRNNSHIKKQNISRLKKTSSYEFYCTLLKNFPSYFLGKNVELIQKKNSQKKAVDNALFCNGLMTSICIDFEGNIRPCVSFRNLRIGNIFQAGSLHDMLAQSQKLQELKSLRRSDIYPCKDCEYNNFCSICLGQIHSESGEINKVSKEFCSFTRALKDICKA